MPDDSILLAADVGGTKTNIRLVKTQYNAPHLNLPHFSNVYQVRYLCQQFDDFEMIAQKFLIDAQTELRELESPIKACFAIAGPVVNNTCQMPNLPWYVDGNKLQVVLGIPQVKLINDFAAIGYGISGLEASDLVPLQSVQPQAQAPIAYIGAGTGLGEGFAIFQNGSYLPYSTEGSDANFAPRNDEEWQLLQYLQKKLSSQHVSYEDLISGRGIVSIYQYLRDRPFAEESAQIGQAVRTWETTQPENRSEDQDPAPLITQAAMDQSDRLSEKTMAMFLEAYGAEAGNLALKILPNSGLYVAGGISAKILPLLENGTFMKGFLAKGRMKHVLERIPVHVIRNQEVGVIGAAICAAQLS